MGYELKQYVQPKTEPDAKVEKYLSYISSGTALNLDDQGSNNQDDGEIYQNVGLKIDNYFKMGTSYYFHSKIKRLTEPQIFYIKLVQNNNPDPDPIQQYIRTINVNAAKEDSLNEADILYDFEFIFTPYDSSFDTVLFQLNRRNDGSDIRYPLMAFIEISEIINQQNGEEDCLPSADFLKMGVQARPGTLMCINNEGIRVPMTGIYEIKEGAIPISFFSVAEPARLISSDLSDLSALMRSHSRYKGDIYAPSECFFTDNENNLIRPMNAFVLDYIYKKKEEE